MRQDGLPSESLATWCHGMADCVACGHSWVAVWPLGAEALECEVCGSFDTDRTAGQPVDKSGSGGA